MIYFDHSSTCFPRPAEVNQALAKAMLHLANPGRSCYEPALAATRCLFQARQELADLLDLANPLKVAWTSGATESLNLVLRGLIEAGDEVITTVLEHNSVLRPLALLGCSISYIPCDAQGVLQLDLLPKLLKSRTRVLISTQASNVCGSLTNSAALLHFCREHGLIFIMDVAQTLGSIPLESKQADILCFSGHKGLGGPPGTGGVVMDAELGLATVKAGGTGESPFQMQNPAVMPDLFEAGSPNIVGIAALGAAVKQIKKQGLKQIRNKEIALSKRLMDGLATIAKLRIVGPRSGVERLPIIALDVKDWEPADLALELWEKHHIATRPGFHCAPLAHQALGTAERGLLRLSMSHSNTEIEVDTVLEALTSLLGRRFWPASGTEHGNVDQFINEQENIGDAMHAQFSSLPNQEKVQEDSGDA